MQTYAIQALKTWQQGKARTFSELKEKPTEILQRTYLWRNSQSNDSPGVNSTEEPTRTTSQIGARERLTKGPLKRALTTASPMCFRFQ